MEAQSPQTMYEDLLWRMSSLETKVKINEQNLFNLQERMQLINTNFLDLKKEIRGRADNMSDELHDLEKKLSSLREKFVQAPKAADVDQIKKFHQSINVLSPEMSADEAKNILDGVLKKLVSGEN